MRPFIALLLSLSLVATVQAATIVSESGNHIKINETRVLLPITITAENNDEITAKNGINLLIDTGVRILWNNASALQASGQAVVNGRIAAIITPEYKNGYTVLHIPVLDNFKAGEDVTLNGLTLRAYDRVFSQRFLGLDVTGDFVADAQDINAYAVENTTATDQSGPFAPTDVAYTVNGDRTAVTLTWVDPPDYDLIGMDLERIVTRNGQTALPEVLVSGTTEKSFVDSKDIQIGDQIAYTLFGRDRRNTGDLVTLTVTITPKTTYVEPPSAPVKDTDTTQILPAQGTVETRDLASLRALYASFKTRYRIKCRTASSTDSACLWAKIDLVYAQKNLGKSDIQADLTARDLSLIKQRVGYSAQRYAKNCSATNLNAPSYCSSLKDALERARYFLNQ
ncbi:hypothetical protein HZA43_01045 [Candidatus Peregrinibacteria bacterium]|nr:hypothetical protein [Candidatus Peregrinibacteria bacterium]